MLLPILGSYPRVGLYPVYQIIPYDTRYFFLSPATCDLALYISSPATCDLAPYITGAPVKNGAEAPFPYHLPALIANAIPVAMTTAPMTINSIANSGNSSRFQRSAPVNSRVAPAAPNITDITPQNIRLSVAMPSLRPCLHTFLSTILLGLRWRH